MQTSLWIRHSEITPNPTDYTAYSRFWQGGIYLAVKYFFNVSYAAETWVNFAAASGAVLVSG